MLAQITVEPWGTRGDGSACSFLRQSTRALAAAVVAVGVAKPASSIGLDMVTADVLTYAHNVPSVPLQWLQDAENLDMLVRSELRLWRAAGGRGRHRGRRRPAARSAARGGARRPAARMPAVVASG